MRLRPSKGAPSRVLHISASETPRVPRYADSLLRSRSVQPDRFELRAVLARLEDILLVPKARVPALVLDALYLYAQVNKFDLPFSEYTRTRNEADKVIKRFLHWYWREVERKK